MSIEQLQNRPKQPSENAWTKLLGLGFPLTFILLRIMSRIGVDFSSIMWISGNFSQPTNSRPYDFLKQTKNILGVDPKGTLNLCQG